MRLEKGADINATDKKGKTALDHANNVQDNYNHSPTEKEKEIEEHTKIIKVLEKTEPKPVIK